MYRIVPVLALVGIGAIVAAADSAQGQRMSSDNGDGTYTNPVIMADYPDCDVIRVASDYYMVSSDFHNVPGDPILHSKDLVNWQVIGHAISSYDSDPKYNMEGGDRYGLGSWAPSIRYHDRTFYVLYNTNDHGAYVSRATNPAGPWEVNSLGVKLYDPGLFFDDDGAVWVVSGQSTLTLTELTPDLRHIKTPPRTIFSGNHYDEGSHVYKRNGYYYILTATTRSDLPTRFALQAERSKSLAGPYETKVIFTDDGNWSGWALHQGGLVETQKGDWWALLFQDRADFGREPTLQPVHWVDDWPVVGVEGRAVITYQKPDVGASIRPYELTRSDDFDAPRLGLQWEWNHNPDNSKWSLSERPGHLRLKTASVTNSWRSARNTLCQRLVEGGPVVVTVKMETSGMVDGDVAGLGMFQIGDSSIGVTANGDRTIVVRNRDKIVATAAIPLKQSSIWLRLQIPGREATVSYLYSLDGHRFVPLGEPLNLDLHMFGFWIGQRIALFSYATKQLGGYVDFDSFIYGTPGRTNLFPAQSRIDASHYDQIESGRAQWLEDPFEAEDGPGDPARSYEMAVGSFARGGSLKFNHIDFGRGVTDVLMNVAAKGPKQVELRLDSVDGPLLASCMIRSNPETEQYASQRCPVKHVQGVHALYLVFANGGDESMRIRWFRFENHASRNSTQDLSIARHNRAPVTAITPGTE